MAGTPSPEAVSIPSPAPTVTLRGGDFSAAPATKASSSTGDSSGTVFTDPPIEASITSDTGADAMTCSDGGSFIVTAPEAPLLEGCYLEADLDEDAVITIAYTNIGADGDSLAVLIDTEFETGSVSEIAHRCYQLL